MIILVTGTSGLVGEAVAFALASAGHHVIGTSRRPNDRLPRNVKQILLDLSAPDGLDALERQWRCDGIVHCAAERNPAPGVPAVVLANCLATQQALRLAHCWNARSFVYISGVAVIGRPVRLPITEDHPVCPLNEYVAAKLFGEHLTLIAGRERPLFASVLRLTAPIGPSMPRNRLLPSMVERALRAIAIEIHGNGSRRQNYVSVEDVARAVNGVISENVSGLFNIGGPDCISNIELARLVVQVLNSNSDVTLSGKPDPEDGVAWDVSSFKAREVFGYQPEIGIEETITDLAAVMRRP